MKIPDLSKIDIKDIDFNKIKEELLERKELVIQILLGTATFFVIISMIGGSQREIKGFNNQIRTMQGKSQAIEDYKKSQAQITAFLKSIPPPLTEGQIISLVTDLADKNKVKILTFSPVASKNDDKKIFQETSIQFSLQTNTYKDMVQLIADIEHAKNMLHLKTCAVQVVAREAEGGAEGSFLNFKIEVASLEVRQ